MEKPDYLALHHRLMHDGAHAQSYINAVLHKINTALR
jgi:hypothetical protein